jgi:NAD(P)-dependent dehydrogenase (short-subunit alcohol dehydrogenase family)
MAVMATVKKKKVMIVTGGSRGIGAAIARLAAATGFAVAVNFARDADAASKTVSTIIAAGGSALAVQADVSRAQDVTRLFATVDAELGTVDVLVNNAGIVGGVVPIEDVEPEFLLHVYSTNVLSTFLCSREAVRRMSSRPEGGVIVNMSSAAARHGGMPGEAHYASSKGAIDSFTIALAKEVAGRNIRVNALRPGVIDTPLHEIHGGAATIAAVAKSIPLGRAGTVEEVACAALWLATDASSYVHGSLIDVTGGR